jgi:hypothetical protein
MALCALDEMAIPLKMTSMKTSRSLAHAWANNSEIGALYSRTFLEAPLIDPLRTTCAKYD